MRTKMLTLFSIGLFILSVFDGHNTSIGVECDNKCRMRRLHYFCPDIPPPTETPCITLSEFSCNFCQAGLAVRCKKEGSYPNHCQKAVIGITKILIRYYESCDREECQCDPGIAVVESSGSMEREHPGKANIIDRYICQ